MSATVTLSMPQLIDETRLSEIRALCAKVDAGYHVHSEDLSNALGTILAAYDAATEWQDISTAPKNKRILGGRWHSNKWVYAIGRWSGQYFRDLRSVKFLATHFQHLPPAPPKGETK